MIASFGKEWNCILSQKFMIFAEMQIFPALMSNQLLKNYNCWPQRMRTLLRLTIQNQAQHLQRQPQAPHDNRNCSLTNSLNDVIKSCISKCMTVLIYRNQIWFHDCGIWELLSILISFLDSSIKYWPLYYAGVFHWREWELSMAGVNFSQVWRKRWIKFLPFFYY